jgi:enoyl-CoA hydratase/carnithine racemase
MMNAIFDEIQAATADDETKAVILAGSGRYYCAGVDLGSTLKPMMPSALHSMIVESNQKLFDTFLGVLVCVGRGGAIVI